MRLSQATLSKGPPASQGLLRALLRSDTSHCVRVCIFLHACLRWVLACLGLKVLPTRKKCKRVHLRVGMWQRITV